MILLDKPGRRGVKNASTPALSRTDRLVRGAIIGAGLLTFVLLAWGHLGLGAWLFPPAPTTAEQVQVTGPYRITLQANSGQLTVHGPNAIAFVVQNQSAPSFPQVQLSADATMTTMPMQASTMTMTRQSTGHFTTHPQFVMAGDWRLTITIVQPGLPDQHATFVVSVRWS